MVVIKEKDIYKGFYAQVKGITNRLAKLQRLNSNNRAPQGPQSANKGNNNNNRNKGDSQDLSKGPSNRQVGGNTIDQEPNIISNTKRAKQVSKEELQYYYNKGLYLYYSLAQYYIATYPFYIPYYQPRLRVTKVIINNAILEDKVINKGNKLGNTVPL